MNVVPLPNAHRASALVEAEALVDRIKAGEVVSFTVVMEHPSGTYSIAGPSTLSRLQTAGALLEAAVQRLQKP